MGILVELMFVELGTVTQLAPKLLKRRGALERPALYEKLNGTICIHCATRS